MTCYFPRWTWAEILAFGAYCGEHDAGIGACWPFHCYRDGSWWTR